MIQLLSMALRAVAFHYVGALKVFCLSEVLEDGKEYVRSRDKCLVLSYPGTF